MPKTKITITKKYYSFRDSSKLLVGILTALAIENALSQLAFGSKSQNNEIRALFNIPTSTYLTFFASITLTLRFFFGNIQYLNSDTNDDGFELIIDATTILLQSMILALITNYINDGELFFLYIIGLFVFDFFWYVIFNIQAHIRGKSSLVSTMGWAQANSMVSIILLVIFGFNYNTSLLNSNLSDFLLGAELSIGRTFFILLSNLIFDLWINGKRYLDKDSVINDL